MFPIKLQRCLNSSNLRSEFPACTLTHAIQSPPWLIYPDWSEVSWAPSLCCHKFVGRNVSSWAIAEIVLLPVLSEAKGNSARCSAAIAEDLPLARYYSTFCRAWFFPPLPAHTARYLLRLCIHEQPMLAEAGANAETGWLPSAHQVPLSFLRPTQEVWQQKQNQQITGAFLIQSMADWLYFLWEQGCLKDLWKNHLLWRFPFQLLMKPFTEEPEVHLPTNIFIAVVTLLKLWWKDIGQSTFVETDNIFY